MRELRAPWTRAELARRTSVALARGGRLGADVFLVDAGAGLAVVKDFASRSRLVRATLGRWLIRREARIYRVLRDHPAVPRFLGWVDPHAFAVEYRPGWRISRRRRRTFGPEFHARLEQAVRDLHARGVAHLDLRHRSNVRAGLDGRPVVIDFGAAARFRPGSLAARLMLPLLARVDRSALRKWRRRLLYAPASPAGAGAAASGRGRKARRPT